MMLYLPTVLENYVLKTQCLFLESSPWNFILSNSVEKRWSAWYDRSFLLEKNSTKHGGAPHYHVLLWIKDAPVIDQDDPDEVLKWIQERITCHIPDKKSDPELHNLVTRYQMHKCSSCCKQKRKVGSMYITRCRFHFPWPTCETAKLNSVSESLNSEYTN